MLESQNPGFRVLNLKTRVPKSMRKSRFSGSGSNLGSIPNFAQVFLLQAVGHFLEKVLSKIKCHDCEITGVCSTVSFLFIDIQQILKIIKTARTTFNVHAGPQKR